MTGAADDGSTLRRLIFSSNRNLIQSEARLLPAPARPAGEPGEGDLHPLAAEIDQTFLANDHHYLIVAAFAALLQPVLEPPPPPSKPPLEAPAAELRARALVIGLGGGSLAMFLYEHLRSMQLACVELDPAVVDVAQRWFGFPAAADPDARRRLAVGPSRRLPLR